MIYLLDTANLEQIKRAFNLYPMEGVTTNPTIISKQKGSFINILKEIRSIIGENKMLHAQAISTTCEEIVKEAEYLNGILGENFYIKVPVIPEGIKAMKALKKKGIKITATAVFTAQQALIAANAGADFVAPYVNRIDNISGNGVDVVGQIVELFANGNVNTKILAASFKNAQQVNEVALLGAESVTVNAEIMDKLIDHPLTTWSVDQFVKDFESVYGEGAVAYNAK
ncbi:fructose-6-phosphate aldolase [Haloimpatiens sp. FM7315]|uniref:fructose-6-phosphate aldolase n=1 Tax=Haloimpatiens sp. FM7315 TaxID=3298609 RepID=UPI0035A31F7C